MTAMPVLRRVIRTLAVWRYSRADSSAAKPESERVRRTFGGIRPAGVPYKLILFGEASLHQALNEFIVHFH
jgi:hypothetical protein